MMSGTGQVPYPSSGNASLVGGWEEGIIPVIES